MMKDLILTNITCDSLPFPNGHTFSSFPAAYGEYHSYVFPPSMSYSYCISLFRRISSIFSPPPVALTNYRL